MVNQKGQVMQYYGATPYITIDSTFLEPKWYGSYCVGHKGWTQPMQSSTHTHTNPHPHPTLANPATSTTNCAVGQIAALKCSTNQSLGI